MKNKVATNSPTAIAEYMISDLGSFTTHNGDRCSGYYEIAKGTGGDSETSVSASLIENKVDLDESEWYYSVHVINDVDGVDAYIETTDDLSNDGLIHLLHEILKDIGCV